MSEPIPDYRNRFAYLIGRIFHPYIICIPALLWLVNDLPLSETPRWAALIIPIVLLPGMTLAWYLQRKGHALYQREVRTPLYLIGWVSVLVCLGILLALSAPRILTASLALWAPMQLLINARITKISTHAAVVAGCATALGMFGKLDTTVTLVLVIFIVLVTVWGRIVTRHHTLLQAVLGLGTGMLPVVVVYGLLLR